MKHKYVLYAIAGLLVINTGLYCIYAVQQSSLVKRVNDFVETTNSRLDCIEESVQKTVPKDQHNGDLEKISERLDLLESTFKKENVAFQSKLDGLADTGRLDVLAERISNLEQAYIRNQALPNQLETKSKSAQSGIQPATPQ